MRVWYNGAAFTAASGEVYHFLLHHLPNLPKEGAIGSGYMIFGFMVFSDMLSFFWVVPISLPLVKFLDKGSNSGQFRLYGQLLAGPNVSGTESTGTLYLGSGPSDMYVMALSIAHFAGSTYSLSR